MWAKGTTPPRLKDKGIPQHFIDQFIEVFASVMKDTGDEGEAYKRAYGVLHQVMVKAGYSKGADGKWVKEEAYMDEILEGWLPEGVYSSDLADGDFAWLGQSGGRKLPYKIHGKINREGWKSAWKATAHPGARHPDFSGGPTQEEVLSKLRRSKPRGITVNRDGTFTDVGGEEVLPFLSATSKSLIVVEEADGGLKFKGVALIDEAVSSNDRYYSKMFNDKCMEATNAYMASGGVVTVYSRHGKAIGSPLGGLPVDLPVGKVTAPLFREGSEIWYSAFIAPTTEGKDVAVLVRSGVMMATSIRATDYESRMRKLNGHPVEEMLSAVIAGIDLADEAGIRGAGIREILEAAPQLTDMEEGVKGDMEIKELTLEQLQAERSDLIDALKASVLEPVTAQLEDVKGKLLALEAEKATWDQERPGLAAKVADLEAALKAAGLTIKVAEAAHIGNLSKTIYEGLKKDVKTEEDISKVLKTVRESALVQFAAGVQSGDTGQGSAKGTSKVPENKEAVTEEPEKDEPITEEFKKILALSL